jgi:lipopolysaccharide/colanic/teichoic acid biosynthesis glycosyltransferase
MDAAMSPAAEPHRTRGAGSPEHRKRTPAAPTDAVTPASPVEWDVEVARPVTVLADGPAAATVAAAEVVTNVVADIVPRDRSEFANRVFNVTLSALALTILSPVFLLVAIAVKFTSRGPIFYMQTRVGLDRRFQRTHAMYDRRTQDLGGEAFTIYKFRSMYVDAERDLNAVWATQQDPRVTPLGRVLRATRLDELPQLINVIKGDMNIVGPRPERPSIFVQLRHHIPEYPMRQRARPGITGWAQINHSYDSCLEDVRRKVQYDLEYLQRQSLAEDIKIMCRTVPVMLFKKGGW